MKGPKADRQETNAGKASTGTGRIMYLVKVSEQVNAFIRAKDHGRCFSRQTRNRQFPVRIPLI
jgi:hypothetical protein